MKQISQLYLLVVLIFLLSACGLSVEDVATNGLSNAIGSADRTSKKPPSTTDSVVLSGGSTIIQEYYEKSNAAGGLFKAAADIVNCRAVFEPNGGNGLISLQLQPQGDSFIFGQDAPPQFVGGGSLTRLTTGPEMPKESFPASCEGVGGLTAVPIRVTDGQIMWLASIDLSKAVWKAPAGTELFNSENGYRVMLLMATDAEVAVPDKAIAYAYDLNPNDLAYDLNPNDLTYDLNPNDSSLFVFQCQSTAITSDADIGPYSNDSTRNRPGRAIMFETVVGSGGAGTISGGGTMFGLKHKDVGEQPLTCADSSDVKMRSADLEIGDSIYKLAEFHFSDLTLQTANGAEETQADVTILGIVPHTIN